MALIYNMNRTFQIPSVGFIVKSLEIRASVGLTKIRFGHYAIWRIFSSSSPSGYFSQALTRGELQENQWQNAQATKRFMVCVLIV